MNVRENKRHCRRADKPPIREVCWSKPTEPSQNFKMASFFHAIQHVFLSWPGQCSSRPNGPSFISLWFCLFLPSCDFWGKASPRSWRCFSWLLAPLRPLVYSGTQKLMFGLNFPTAPPMPRSGGKIQIWRSSTTIIKRGAKRTIWNCKIVKLYKCDIDEALQC